MCWPHIDLIANRFFLSDFGQQILHLDLWKAEVSCTLTLLALVAHLHPFFSNSILSRESYMGWSQGTWWLLVASCSWLVLEGVESTVEFGSAGLGSPIYMTQASSYSCLAQRLPGTLSLLFRCGRCICADHLLHSKQLKTMAKQQQIRYEVPSYSFLQHTELSSMICVLFKNRSEHIFFNWIAWDIVLNVLLIHCF